MRNPNDQESGTPRITMCGNPILTYETMRKVALEIVQLGRDVPEEEWFEEAEHYATSLIRRLCEEVYDEGRQTVSYGNGDSFDLLRA